MNKRLSKNDFNPKVRVFNGSTIAEMYFYLGPPLKKELEYVILHVGTNDCGYTSGNEVCRKLLGLKILKIKFLEYVLSYHNR